MRLIDTVVLMAAINPNDKLHEVAREHLKRLSDAEDTYLPAPILIEFDLELKSHGFTEDERAITFEDLTPVIPPERVFPQSVIAMASAAEFQRSGMSYFDSLISSMAKELEASVITTDRAIAARVQAEW